MLRNRARLILSVFIVVFFVASIILADNTAGLLRNTPEGQIERTTPEARQLEEKRVAGEKAEKVATKKAKKSKKIDIDKLKLPEDTTPRLQVSEVKITGNTLIETKKLLKDVPQIFNKSSKPLAEASSADLYDFRTLREVIVNPGQPREISTRTIEGFTQYILSMYQHENYAGIYVNVPAETLVEGTRLKDNILVISVVELPVSEVTVTSYDANMQKTEKSVLGKQYVKEWSPIKEGKVANKKDLDDFINLLNLNPDRYVLGRISEGPEKKSLSLKYDIYEINPWHYFAQIDNSGTRDQQWSPRIGVINTDLTHRDDTFMLVAQGHPDSTITTNYSFYGSYDVPLWSQKLRFKVFAGHNEFDVDNGSSINFLGNGTFYGGTLRYNFYQVNNWFFDVLGTFQHQESKFTPSLFSQAFRNTLNWNLLTGGLDIHHKDNLSNTSFTADISQSMNPSDKTEFNKARTGAEPYFSVMNLAAYHSQFIDPNKIHHVLGSFKYIVPDTRLAPAAMTVFGGMYTVRGYKESGIVADGGVLASVQYEYDIISKLESQGVQSKPTQKSKWAIRRLAPLVFFDYGRAKNEVPIPAGENEVENLYSIGTGIVTEIGEHFNAGVYYGYPLRETSTTDVGHGRFNVALMVRW